MHPFLDIEPEFDVWSLLPLRMHLEVTTSERDAFTLRLKPDLLRFVKEAAEDQNRSVPNYVETVLLAEKKRQDAKAARPPDNE